MVPGAGTATSSGTQLKSGRFNERMAGSVVEGEVVKAGLDWEENSALAIFSWTGPPLGRRRPRREGGWLR